MSENGPGRSPWKCDECGQICSGFIGACWRCGRSRPPDVAALRARIIELEEMLQQVTCWRDNAMAALVRTQGEMEQLLEAAEAVACRHEPERFGPRLHWPVENYRMLALKAAIAKVKGRDDTPPD